MSEESAEKVYTRAHICQDANLRDLSPRFTHICGACVSGKAWNVLLWHPTPIRNCINELDGCEMALHQTAPQLALNTPVWGQTAWARTTSFYFSKETLGMFWTLQKPFPPTFKPQSTVAGQWGCQLRWIQPGRFALSMLTMRACVRLLSLLALMLSERTFRPQCNVVYCGKWGGCFVWSKKPINTPHTHPLIKALRVWLWRKLRKHLLTL